MRSPAGFSLHAGVAVPARDRRRLERLCRYVARPPIATERLSRRTDGRLLYHLKHRWRDGTTHVVFEPQELLERLAALVPPPRFHQVRYHGILAPCAGERDRVVPARGEARAVPASPRDRAEKAPTASADPVDAALDPTRARRLAWAELLRRVFAIDVLECPRCGGRLRVLTAIHAPEARQAILSCLGLSARAPPLAAPSPSNGEVEEAEWPQ